MLTKEEKLEKIFIAIENRGISAYTLAKETKLNESGINRILNKKVKSPQNSTVDLLYGYLYDTNTVVDKNLFDIIEKEKLTEKEGIDIVSDNIEYFRNKYKYFDLIIKDIETKAVTKFLEDQGIKVEYK